MSADPRLAQVRAQLADRFARVGYHCAAVLVRQQPLPPDAPDAIARDVLGRSLPSVEVLVEGATSPDALTVAAAAVQALALGADAERVGFALELLERRACGRCAVEVLFELQSTCVRCEAAADPSVREARRIASVAATRARGHGATVHTRFALGAWRAWVAIDERALARTPRRVTEAEALEALIAALAKELLGGTTP